MDFNVFYYTATTYKKNIRYNREYTIPETFFYEVCSYIANNKTQYFVIDMKNIVSYPTKMFVRLEEYLRNVFFCNVENENIKMRLCEDLSSLEWIDETSAGYKECTQSEINEFKKYDYSQVRKKEQCRIIADIVRCEERNCIFLESSGLYSNCFVNIKQLFRDVPHYYFITFCLAELIYPDISKNGIDALVSSSKNGAIIANVLGGLLDVKEVHLIGAGPKFSMEIGDSIECIKKGKKYAYIFDFLCTGTELKMASALINSKKAHMDYAAGIAEYKRDVELFAVKKKVVLVNTEEMHVDFLVVGKKCDLG